MSKTVKVYNLIFNVNGSNAVYSDIVNTMSKLSSKVLLESCSSQVSANAKSLMNIVRLDIVPKGKYVAYIIGGDNIDDDCRVFEDILKRYSLVELKE